MGEPEPLFKELLQRLMDRLAANEPREPDPPPAIHPKSYDVLRTLSGE